TGGGGYRDASGNPSTVLEDDFTHTDQSIGKIIARLQARGLFDSTLIIVTAKHGDSPIDPEKLRRADLELIPKTVAAIDKGLLAGVEQDGSGALICVSDRHRTPDVVPALNKIHFAAAIRDMCSCESL